MTTSISLVTGAAGFIGSHVCDHVLAKGHAVIAMDDLSGSYRENVPAGAEFVEWAKAAGQREPSRFERIEISRDLHSFWQHEEEAARRAGRLVT
jgi:nucleoside-diphosphate-sugar epimerase